MATITTLTSAIQTLCAALVDGLGAVRFRTVAIGMPSGDPAPEAQPACYIALGTALSQHEPGLEPIWIQQIELHVYHYAQAGATLSALATLVEACLAAINDVTWCEAEGAASLQDHVRWIEARNIDYDRGQIVTEQQGVAIVTLEALIAP